MPEHYERYQFLHETWSEFSDRFSILSPQSQWQLHELYRPAEVLTSDELAAHIKKVLTAKPTLVNQVGKHLRILKANLQQSDRPAPASLLRLAVRSVVQPEPSSERASSNRSRARKERRGYW